jgi:hypothetical protein
MPEDNPESGTVFRFVVTTDPVDRGCECLDIAGANAAGWSSVLVGTGVFQPSDQRIPPHTPTLIVDNVEQAVEYAINEHAQL